MVISPSGVWVLFPLVLVGGVVFHYPLYWWFACSFGRCCFVNWQSEPPSLWRRWFLGCCFFWRWCYGCCCFVFWDLALSSDGDPFVWCCCLFGALVWCCMFPRLLEWYCFPPSPSLLSGSAALGVAFSSWVMLFSPFLVCVCFFPVTFLLGGAAFLRLFGVVLRFFFFST